MKTACIVDAVGAIGAACLVAARGAVPASL